MHWCGKDAQVEMGSTPSTNGPIEMHLCSYNVGPQGWEQESWKTKDQVFGRVQGNDWWTVDT
jgi:hypothetical protein